MRTRYRLDAGTERRAGKEDAVGAGRGRIISDREETSGHGLGQLAVARKIGLLSSFPPTLASMPREFPASVELVPKLAEGAMAALDRGDRAEHDRLVTEASKDLRACDIIALAQYSMAPAAGKVAEATGRPVLTTPDSAVMKMKAMLGMA